MYSTRYTTEGTLSFTQIRHYIPLRGTPLDTLYPREDTIPSKDDLEITEAEERMATEFNMNQSPDVP